MKVEQLLRNLKLRRILEVFEEQLRAAEDENVSYSGKHYPIDQP